MNVQVLQSIASRHQLNKHKCKFHSYLLLQHPHVSHLSLAVIMQPPQLLAGLLDMIVLPDQLNVVLSHCLQLLFQLGMFACQSAVQCTEEIPMQVPSD